MKGPIFGAIADDFTGATDIASMLTKGGIRVIQTIGVPPASALETPATTALQEVSSKDWAMILADHGSAVAGIDLDRAMYATEDLEQTSKLALILRSANPNLLAQSDINDLDLHFPPL